MRYMTVRKYPIGPITELLWNAAGLLGRLLSERSVTIASSSSSFLKKKKEKKKEKNISDKTGGKSKEIQWGKTTELEQAERKETFMAVADEEFYLFNAARG